MSKKKRISKTKPTRRDAVAKPERPRNRKPLYVGGGLLLLVVAAWIGFPEPPQRQPYPAEHSWTIRFEEAESGVDFVLNNGTIDAKPMPDSTLGGVALFECDNDGLLDIYFTNGARFPDFEKADPAFHNRL